MNTDELFETGLNSFTQRLEKEKFYKASIIRDYLICPCCDQRFTNPINLHCSHNICLNCFKSLHKEFPIEKIDCPVCQTENQVPRTGFPINTLIVSLLELEPVEIRRGKNFETLTESTCRILTELNSIIAELNDKIINAEANIKRFCGELREQVNYATNKKIDQLNQNREIFFAQIIQFEKICLNEFFNKETNLRDMLDKCLFDVDEWKVRAQAPDSDESDVDNIKILAENMKKKLYNENLKFNSLLFGEQKIQFIEDNHELVLDSIGQIKYEKSTENNSYLENINSLSAIH